MARTKEFDPDVVLDLAMDLFWQRGFEATSMADLVEHLGIGKASIYAAFGCKRDLFIKALRRYLELAEERITGALSRPGPAVPAIRALLDYVVSEAREEHRYLGCLVSNTAVELAARDPEIAALVESGWARWETVFTSAFARAHAQGELAADRDPRALARFLLVFLQGVWVIDRTPDAATRLRDAGDMAAAFLFDHHAPAPPTPSGAAAASLEPEPAT
ncbi:TetR/AcrR family transcriptional regulator [Nocardia amikacinitolerans]|uniref:TetR/AcrR family transcriptional regulator n=1 Tax=Nocardia amikacinitolerans TaxID=756689 RepID=UPI0020A51596|nr:TetR/AcrR family transcriptional regulator [Nocardia amikacinitolerans]MCP2288052.1 transcriptional regulator, TetR family [Nocardia amikacinitolerans]